MLLHVFQPKKKTLEKHTTFCPPGIEHFEAPQLIKKAPRTGRFPWGAHGKYWGTNELPKVFFFRWKGITYQEYGSFKMFLNKEVVDHYSVASHFFVFEIKVWEKHSVFQLSIGDTSPFPGCKSPGCFFYIFRLFRIPLLNLHLLLLLKGVKNTGRYPSKESKKFRTSIKQKSKKSGHPSNKHPQISRTSIEKDPTLSGCFTPEN